MENEELEKNINFRVPADLCRKVKTKAAKEGVKIKFVGTELFKYWLKNGVPT